MVSEKDLSGKTVMTEEGLCLGRLHNSTLDKKTGDLVDILVEPSDEIDARLYNVNDKGHLIFPFKSIKHVGDVVVVESRL